MAITKIGGRFSDTISVRELRGDYPDVPFAAGVDREALTAGDDDPMFLTLPIGQAGATSGNGRHYDEEWIRELERQTVEGRPVGTMGHIAPGDRATAFPPEAIHWVGAARQGELLWGKGYVPPGPARERIRRYKATGAKIATSIDAFAEGVYDAALKAYRMAAKSLRLNQIDIAPADRAGIPALATVPVITTEMADGGEDDKGEMTMTDRVQVIREMTVEDADLLPKPVREAVLAAAPVPAEVGVVQEIRQAMGLDEKGDVLAAVREMQQQREAERLAAIERRITELAGEVKVEDVRGMVVELVKLRNPQTAGEAEAAYKAVMEMGSVQKMLAARVQEMAGPPVRPMGDRAANGTGRYFNIPKES
jgi:hypothetical protein